MRHPVGFRRRAPLPAPAAPPPGLAAAAADAYQAFLIREHLAGRETATLMLRRNLRAFGPLASADRVVWLSGDGRTIHHAELPAEEDPTVTKYPDLFRALAEEFATRDVKSRPQGGRQLLYITARTAMNRLDAVLGPENWWDEYVPQENSVLCRLSIRLPDGQVLTKCDAGGYAGMADHGDDDKSGYSDAFKRAAVKFGVARYLYRDGVPEFAGGGPPAAPAPDPPAAEAWASYAARTCRAANDDWRNEIAIEGVEEERRSDLVNVHQLGNHVASKAVEGGLIEAAAIADARGKRDRTKATAAVSDLFRRFPGKVRKTVEVHLKELRRRGRAELGIFDPEDESQEAPAATHAGREPGREG